MSLHLVKTRIQLLRHTILGKKLKPNIYIHVRSATHFLSWERSFFEKNFNLVQSPSSDCILFVFGPDALASGAVLPAKLRVVLLFPGFSLNPFHDIIHRYGMRKIIDESYDIVFVNPGPIHEAFLDSSKIRVCPFSINTSLIKIRNPRKKIDSLVHVSADYPQKDWERSRDIMKITGLRHEVFPSRELTMFHRVSRRLHIWWHKKRYFAAGYLPHSVIVEKYHQYDGFVHVAAETPPLVDGKYTASLLEAGLTGAILFWHDTLGLGNDFETIFSISKDPATAANEILNIRNNINVELHSKRTAEEIYERCNPEVVMDLRVEKILELL